MKMNFPNVRSLCAAATAAMVLVLGACGGDAGGAGGAGSGGGGRGGARPDMSLVEKKLLDNATAQTEGQAHLVNFKETRCEKTDEMGGAENWEVQVQFELEFGGPCYFHNAERAKGARARFEYTTNFIHDTHGQWIQEPGRIDEL